MTPLHFKVKLLQVLVVARTPTAFPFEVIESLLDCQCATSQYERVFLIKAKNAQGNEALTCSAVST